MAAARRRRRDEEARTRELGETGKEEAGERSLAGEAVRLQELLGNVSATGVMARSSLQRDTAQAEADPAKAGGEETAVAYTMTLDGIGSFPLLSWSWSGADSGAGGGGGGPGKATFRNLSASKTSDEHTPKLMQHAQQGRHIKTGELRSQRGEDSFVVRLKDVLVDSVQAQEGPDPPAETFALSFAEVEFDHGQKAK